jgi:hypothetical protein
MRPEGQRGEGQTSSVPSWQASFGDAPDGFVIKMVNLCRELKSGFLGGCPMFVWSAP